MRVQVDEARCDHEAGRIDDPLGAAQPGADGGDLAIHYRHIADGVHPTGRIHHPAAPDHRAAHIVTPHTKKLQEGRNSAAGTLERPHTGGLSSNRDRFSDRRPPPPMRIYQNNPMQSSRRPPASAKNNLTRRANQRHSFIIPKSCKRPSPRNSGRVGDDCGSNPHPQLKLHRIAAASDRLRVAEPRACRARARESRHEHRSGPRYANGDRRNRPDQSCRSPADKTAVARILHRPSRSGARRTADG